MRFLIIAFLVLMLLPTASQADSWIAVRMLTVRSQNGMFMATITPATSNPVNVPCIARLFRVDSLGSSSLVWRAILINEVRPYSAIVTNFGQLVTFDEWGDVGGPNAITIYDHSGHLLRTYALEEFIPKSMINKLSTSTSSVWWWFSANLEVGTDTLSVLVKSDGRPIDSLANVHSLRIEYALRELRVCLRDGAIVTPIDPSPAGIKTWREIEGP